VPAIGPALCYNARDLGGDFLHLPRLELAMVVEKPSINRRAFDAGHRFLNSEKAENVPIGFKRVAVESVDKYAIGTIRRDRHADPPVVF
jgi:hypothetical protein